MRIFIAFLFLFGLAFVVFGYSRTLPHLNDQAAFDAAYAEMQDNYYADREAHLKRDNWQAAWDEKSTRYFEDYHDLRESHLTDRDPLKRFSLTLMVLSAAGMLLFVRGIHGLRTPPSKWLIIPIGLAAIAINVGGIIEDENEAYGRGDIPLWADTGPGLFVGLLFFGSVLIIFVLAHSLFLIGRKFTSGHPIFPMSLKKVNLLLAMELFVALGFALWSAYNGTSYFSLIATPVWVYFYLSLMAVRAHAHSKIAGVAA